MSDLGIVLLGPPGAGKGTQAAALVAEHGLAYLPTGELLRAAAQAGTPAGREAQRFMSAGELVPDAVLFAAAPTTKRRRSGGAWRSITSRARP
jgi:adenylate kinase